jgi:hypothetical protein
MVFQMYFVASVTKTFTFKDVQTIHRSRCLKMFYLLRHVSVQSNHIQPEIHKKCCVDGIYSNLNIPEKL